MDYKVCILAAGIGSKMSEFTSHFNKALIPVQGKPAICHIIEKFPKDVEIVIAVGYMKEGLTAFLKTAYPDRKLTFVEVDKYSGVGTGPGYSLLKCKDNLQCPFIFFAADTLVREVISEPTCNWFGVMQLKDGESRKRYCTARVKDSKIGRIDDKIETDNTHAFIGLAGVKDYGHFWTHLGSNKNLVSGEIQVSNGFTSLIDKGMLAEVFTWFDTGTPNAYAYTLANYPDGKGYSGD